MRLSSAVCGVIIAVSACASDDAGPASPCAAGLKTCNGACVSASEPGYGCADESCEPCGILDLISHNPIPMKYSCAPNGGCVAEPTFVRCPPHGDGFELESDPFNCGACGVRCVNQGGPGECRSGQCYASCKEDDSNCGACGYVCTPGSSCAEGLCRAELVAAFDRTSPSDLVRAGKNLYFISTEEVGIQRLMKVDVATRETTELHHVSTTFNEHFFGLVVDGDSLYVGLSPMGALPGVYQFPSTSVCGAGCPTLIAGMESVQVLGVDATYVYWLQQAGDRYRKRKDGSGDVEKVGTGPHETLGQAALAGTTLFYQPSVLAADTDPFEIRALTLDGTKTTLVSGVPPMTPQHDFVVLGDRLYYAGPSSSISSVPVAGGAPASFGDIAPITMAGDGDTLYGIGVAKTDGGVDADFVFAAPRSGVCPPAVPCPTRLAQTRSFSPYVIAVDEAYVYWIETYATSPSVLRRVKR